MTAKALSYEELSLERRTLIALELEKGRWSPGEIASRFETTRAVVAEVQERFYSRTATARRMFYARDRRIAL
jgi:hypothetical protein